MVSLRPMGCILILTFHSFKSRIYWDSSGSPVHPLPQVHDHLRSKEHEFSLSLWICVCVCVSFQVWSMDTGHDRFAKVGACFQNLHNLTYVPFCHQPRLTLRFWPVSVCRWLFLVLKCHLMPKNETHWLYLQFFKEKIGCVALM